MPKDMQLREHIVGTIESIFKKYAFQRIETPSLELNKTLSGKYGEEGDRLMFKILPRGRKLEKFSGMSAAEMSSNAEEALRYDLTVPFARFIVDNRNDLTFPFKRYQIQNVWRADRPQHGRYREFTQCDADVVGISGIIQEAELLHIYNDVFAALGVKVSLHLNHRKLLQAIADQYGAADNWIAFTIALDKLDKIGWEKVQLEWEALGIKTDEKLRNTLEKGLELNTESLNSLTDWLSNSSDAKEAIDELKQLAEILKINPLSNAELKLDLTLARGLDYYTGCIFEAKIPEANVGSVGGGGRYDDLTSVFGLKDTPGVGISFGLDRIQLAMEQLNLTEEIGQSPVKVMIANMGEELSAHYFQLAGTLRKEGMACEIYPSAARLKKQINFSGKTGIQLLLISGETEKEKGIVNLKNLETGDQKEVPEADLLIAVQEALK